LTDQDDLSRRLRDLVARSPGSRLPTERALSHSLGISRHALRQLLGTLAAEGRLWRHVGRGTFAGHRAASPPDQPAADLTRNGTPRELVEARQMLEPPLAAAAALRGSPAAIARIQEACRQCEAAQGVEDYETWDEALHRAIVAAAGNSLLVGLFETINQARKDIVWGLLRHSPLMRERRPLYLGQHARIVAAIAARDAEGAWKHMREHTDTIADIYAKLEPAGPDGRPL
jgi:DNA-binding FadR family transcriptional regulator